MPNQYKKINKTNLTQFIVYQKLDKYKKDILQEIIKENVINEEELKKIKLKFEQQINLKIYYQLNKFKF